MCGGGQPGEASTYDDDWEGVLILSMLGCDIHTSMDTTFCESVLLELRVTYLNLFPNGVDEAIGIAL